MKEAKLTRVAILTLVLVGFMATVFATLYTQGEASASIAGCGEWAQVEAPAVRFKTTEKFGDRYRIEAIGGDASFLVAGLSAHYGERVLLVWTQDDKFFRYPFSGAGYSFDPATFDGFIHRLPDGQLRIKVLFSNFPDQRLGVFDTGLSYQPCGSSSYSATPLNFGAITRNLGSYTTRYTSTAAGA
jgi:rRNA maturation protein Nop10